MGEPAKAIEILKTVREWRCRRRCRTTEKLRRGYDYSAEALCYAFDAIIQAGHACGYAGPAPRSHGRSEVRRLQPREFLGDLKRRYPAWTIIGSRAMCLTAHDVVRMLRETGKAGTLCARPRRSRSVNRSISNSTMPRTRLS